MEIKFDVELTPLQEKMSEGIDWYICSTARADGKTMLSCMAFIKRGYMHLGQSLPIFDHYYMYHGDKTYVHSMIASLFQGIKDNKRYSLEINPRDNTMKIRYATNKEIKEAKDKKEFDEVSDE